jgi:hypothetical protein
MASMTPLIFPNFPKRPETGAPVIPELPAAPIRGGGNGNGIGIWERLTNLLERNTDMAPIRFTIGVARGLREGEFADINPACRKKLMALISRISESSFRRGLQHGEYFTLKGRKLWIKTADLRFDVSLDKSPAADDRGFKPSALERLRYEYGGTLQALGFGEVANHE